MKSIRDIFKIGKGPSSSHTMGPEAAAKEAMASYPNADFFEVTLYGSLSKTGRGHGTDRAIISTFGDIPSKVIFAEEDPEDMRHPNTLDIRAFEHEQEIGKMRVQSIGGGDIVIEGRKIVTDEHEVYFENSFAEIRDFCTLRSIDLSEYVFISEGEEIKEFLHDVWQKMKESVERGLSKEGVLPGGLNVVRKAKLLYNQKLQTEHAEVLECRKVSAYAYAVCEENADNGVIVTAPTCGSSGVVPSVLYYIQEKRGLSDDEMVKALAVAGLFGKLAK